MGGAEGVKKKILSISTFQGPYVPDPSDALSYVSPQCPALPLPLPRQCHPVFLGDSKSKDFEVGRTSLIPGLLKGLAYNKHNSPPLRLFEFGDVLLQVDPAISDTGAKNLRLLSAVVAGPTSGFEVINGLLNQVMWCLQGDLGQGRLPYSLTAPAQPAELPHYFQGRAALIKVTSPEGAEVLVGHVGVVHPLVLEQFAVPFAVSALELNIEPFLHWM